MDDDADGGKHAGGLQWFQIQGGYVCKYWNGHKWSEVTGNNTEMGQSPEVRLEMVPDVTTFPKGPKNEFHWLKMLQSR